MNAYDFIGKVAEEYSFAISKEFDSIKIIIETDNREYIISEYENGFVNDEVERGCIYDEIDKIADDVFSIINRNGDKVVGFRIE